MNGVSYEIKEHIGDLKSQSNGWKKEVNIVSWNDGPDVVDIRDWNPEHDRMSRGIKFTKGEAKVVQDILKEKLPSEEDFPKQSVSAPVGSDFSVHIEQHLGTYAAANSGWTHEVNIASWNGNAPIVDFRQWSPDHQRMSRGLTLKREEALAFSQMELSKDPKANMDSADLKAEVLNLLISQLAETSHVEFLRNETGEVKVVPDNESDSISLRLNGRLARISVEEVI